MEYITIKNFRAFDQLEWDKEQNDLDDCNLYNKNTIQA